MSFQNELAIRAQSCGLKVECGGDGDVRAKIVIISERPGHNEVRMRMPLVGQSGQLLWQCLRKFGLNRADCYVTNVVKRLCGEEEKLGPDEMSNWKGLLEWELGQLTSAKYFLVLGGTALYVTTGHNSIESWRGSVTEDNGVYHVFSYNPAFVIRNPHLEPIFMLDMQKLKTVSTGDYKPHVIVPSFDPSPNEAIAWCQRMRHEGKPVSFDIETNSATTVCVGLANNAYEGMCINFRNEEGNRWSTREEASVRRAIAETLTDPKVKLVAQNGNFDAYWLWYNDRIRVRRVWFDTLLAHHLLYPTLPHNLGFLTSQYTTHPYYKDEIDVWKEGGDISSFWIYNVKDCCITWQVADRLGKELVQQKLDKFFFDHVMHLQPYLTEATVLGMLVDVEMKERIRGELFTEVERLLEKFYETVYVATNEPGYKPNPNSPKQMQELYFKRLGVVGKGFKTDKTNRKWIAMNPRTGDAAKAVIVAQDEYVKEHKFFSTYAESAIDPDNRFRAEYKQFGTTSAPGRLSSSKNAWGTAMNIQNQPKRADAMYIADPGYTFVYFDLSQAEARYVAWEAKIDKWKEQFERARIDGVYDAHRALAADMFEMPYDDVPKDDMDSQGLHSLRYIAKRCRHGLNYRMQVDRLAEVTGLPMAKAQDAFQRYHRATPELRKWWHEVEQEVRTNRCLYNAFGRRFLIMGKIVDEEQLTPIIAFKPQSTIGDKVSMVMYQSQEDDKWPMHSKILINRHDSLTALVPLNAAKTALSVMTRYAEQPIMVRGEPMIIPAEGKISQPGEDGIRRLSSMEKVKL